MVLFPLKEEAVLRRAMSTLGQSHEGVAQRAIIPYGNKVLIAIRKRDKELLHTEEPRKPILPKSIYPSSIRRVRGEFISSQYQPVSKKHNREEIPIAIKI